MLRLAAASAAVLLLHGAVSVMSVHHACGDWGAANAAADGGCRESLERLWARAADAGSKRTPELVPRSAAASVERDYDSVEWGAPRAAPDEEGDYAGVADSEEEAEEVEAVAEAEAEAEAAAEVRAATAAEKRSAVAAARGAGRRRWRRVPEPPRSAQAIGILADALDSVGELMGGLRHDLRSSRPLTHPHPRTAPLLPDVVGGGGGGVRRLHALRPLRRAEPRPRLRSFVEPRADTNHHDPGLLWAGLGRRRRR